MASPSKVNGYDITRNDAFLIDPRAITVDWKKNISRGRKEPKVDDDLKALARDMRPRTGSGESEDGSSGQINPIICRRMTGPEKGLELVGGFRRLRAGLWNIESGECPDFKIKYTVSSMSDAEAALANMAENILREDPEPIQYAHAIRTLHEDYGLDLKTVAARLKMTDIWAHNLLSLAGLPKEVQDEVQTKEIGVTAAINLAKLPPAKQKPAFRKLKESANGKKVSTAAVKKATREEGIKSKRTIKDVKEFLEGKVGPAEFGKALATVMLSWLDGHKTDADVDKAWDMTCK